MATWVGYPRSYTPGRNRPIQYVVIHTTEGGEGLNAAENGAAYDKIRTDGTSTHLFVDPNSALQEVPFSDRAHAARFHGNEIGIQIELCGYAGQSWAQWHDGASTAELHLAAKEVAAICRTYAIPVKHLTVAEVRAAYYNNAAGQRPKGICSHYDVTRAYPEDGGTHTDPGPSYPWDEFLAMVRAELNEEDDMDPQALHDILWQLDGIAKGDNPVVIPALSGGLPERRKTNVIRAELDQVLAQLATPVPVEVDADAVAAALVANEEFLAALAKAVNDDEAARMAD